MLLLFFSPAQLAILDLNQRPQRKLVQAATAADSAGGVQSSFSFVTPSSAVFQVIIGGGGGGFIGGGAAAAAPAGGAPVAEAAPAKEEKEEKEEESDDEDFGMALFDAYLKINRGNVGLLRKDNTR